MLRENARDWAVKEQVVADAASGLTFQFEVRPDGVMRLALFGQGLPFGNREILFKDGEECAAGSFTGLCRPAWPDREDDDGA